MPKMHTAKLPRTANHTRHIVPLSLPHELARDIEATAAAIRMSKQETMRQALMRGLPIVRELLAITARAA